MPAEGAMNLLIPKRCMFEFDALGPFPSEDFWVLLTEPGEDEAM